MIDKAKRGIIKGGENMIFENKFREMYRNALFKRADTRDDMRFFSVSDFSGLKRDSYSFLSVRGYKLAGQFYYYEKPIKDRIIIFEHGMSGGGHRAYMREIDILAKEGYKVFAYDHTGCADSEGESTNGFAQSLCDLDSCIRALRSDDKYKESDISVVGHSWGAFSAMNITAIHPDITHIVAISGFISVKDMHRQLFGGAVSVFRKAIYAVEKEANPDYVKYNAAETLYDTSANVLIIHSKDDKAVKARYHFAKLKVALRNKKNVRFLLTSKKGHNPNYTVDAVRYLNEFMNSLNKKHRVGELSTAEAKARFINNFDFVRMTEQDKDVWKVILEFLKEKQI